MFEDQPFPFCVPVQLPTIEAIKESISVAYSINPANRFDADAVKPDQLAVLKTSYWGPAGVDLGVSFLEPTSTELRDKILKYANLWNKKANINFRYSKSQGDVRISFKKGGGYWSYLGTDIRQISPGSPTMNLDSFTVNTPDSEYKRVVCHEFGHTLGFPHEHMRKGITSKIDPQKAYAYFKKNVGWSKSMVDSQVLTPLDESKLKATIGARSNSIMCYQLPGSIMTDGIAVPGGAEIDIVDYDLARKLYPKYK